MPTINAVYTLQGTPAASVVTTDDTPTYEDIRRSLGQYVFSIYMLYLNTPGITQLTTPYYFNRYDANGTITNINLSPAVDPQQRQNTLFFDVSQFPMYINGQNNLQFSLQPQTTLQLVLYTIQNSVSEFYMNNTDPALSANNFKAVETDTGKYNFFEDFKPRIEWADHRKERS